MDAESVYKVLKTFILITKNTKPMKLAAIMYLRKIILPKKCGINHRAKDDTNKKPLRMSEKTSLLT